jgi:site-specific DNA-methyltransferase (adenine-specific)
MRAMCNQLIVGDVRDRLPKLAAASVDCVITSPPYFRLRNYGQSDQIGLETSVDGWVDELRVVMQGVARVLKPTGSVWLNLGDTYSHHEHDGARPKSLLFAPELLALAMIEDGWVIRNKVVWAKTNPMPTSVRDRLSCTYEVFYLAVRSQHYFFDLDAIREPHRSSLRSASAAEARRAANGRRPRWAGPLAGSNVGLHAMKASGLVGHPLGKNPGDVWTHATSTDRGVHHAMFPIDLIRRPLRASCPERVCARCSVPWERTRERTIGHPAVIGELEARCSCDAPTQPGLVLDPFMGAGTVAIAAEANRRHWLGIELNPDFAQLSETRIERARAQRIDKENEAAVAA